MLDFVKRRWTGVLYTLVLCVIAILVLTWWTELWSIWREHRTTFLGLVLLMSLGIAVQTRNFIEFIPAPHSIKPWPFLHVWAVSSLANYAGPFQPGIAVRMLYLRRQGVAVANSALATLRQTGVSVWVALACISLSLLLIQGVHPLAFGPLAVFLMVFLLRRVLTRGLLEVSRPRWLARGGAILSSVVAETSPSGVAGVVAQYVVGTLVLLWCYRRFGVDITLGEALLLTSAVYLSSLIAVLPGNLGLLEGIYFISGHALGMTAHEAAAAAFLLRVSHVTSCLVVSGTTLAFSGRRAG